MRRRPLLRTAAVGGGAYMAGRAMGRRSEQQADAEPAQDQQAQYQQSGQPQAGQPQGSPPGPGPSAADQIGQLSTLHQQGALTDDEFAAAKAKILGS